MLLKSGYCWLILIFNIFHLYFMMFDNMYCSEHVIKRNKFGYHLMRKIAPKSLAMLNTKFILRSVVSEAGLEGRDK